MQTSEAQKRASAKWNKSRDNIVIRPEKEVGAAIRSAAEASGMSLQNYILKAVYAEMEREKEKAED